MAPWYVVSRFVVNYHVGSRGAPLEIYLNRMVQKGRCTLKELGWLWNYEVASRQSNIEGVFGPTSW